MAIFDRKPLSDRKIKHEIHNLTETDIKVNANGFVI